MASNIKHHISFLKKIGSATKNNRVKYLNLATDSEIRSICECALNVCKGTVPLSKKSKTYLKRHGKVLKNIAFRKACMDTKRKNLVQKGGFLPQLLAAAIPVIASLIVDHVT
jgi:hypothetical protein